ncbi:MAG: hypothetical protein RMJ98_22860 [Myxococcales bacterium]|nr:hypothetical protein [Myxococcales bacterium]
MTCFLIVLALATAFLSGCGVRLSESGAPLRATPATIAPAAVKAQFSGSDPLPRVSLSGSQRPRTKLPDPVAPPD